MAVQRRYDQIGRGYLAARRPDPRILAQLLAALGPAATVLNVGAGTGSYEPADREVVAVEPSALMIAQRPPDAAPVVQAVAEHLPFFGGSFDAALAVLSMHHWADWRCGVAELLRVAAERVVVLTFDPLVSHDFWLVRDYFPSVRDVASDRFELAEVRAVLGARVEDVPVPADCTDGFLACYWRRPDRYLDASVRAAMSCFHSIGEADLNHGIERLRADLESGAWKARYGHLLAEDSFDGGYRLLVTVK